VSEPGPALAMAPEPEPAGRGAEGLWAFVRRRPVFLTGYVIVGVMAWLAVFAPMLPLRSPVDADVTAYLVPPGPAHWMGTDTAGLDVLSRTLHAPRVDLTIALVATLAAAAIGGTLGAYAGLWSGAGALRGVAANVLLRTGDIVLAFPVFALALVLVAVLGQGTTALVIAITVVNIPLYLRLMHAETLSLRRQAYVEAARIAGASDSYLLRHHIVPGAAATLLSQMSTNAGSAVLIASGLSFIGAGVRAPTPEWGSMIAMGFQNVITGQWWPSIFPGLALSLTVFGLGQVGASILAYADPRERQRPSRRAWKAFASGVR
jgi:peptide/nickel transport system permease protein